MGRLIVFGLVLTSVYVRALSENSAQVEVRAVLINCEPDDRQKVSYDTDAISFEREELYKHSVLKDCKKKLALTVKIASDPEVNSGDEYVPIEHVFQGPTKRVRLLNPYVLRLRRESPVQAYKLRRIDTVSGSLADEREARIKRNLQSPDMSQDKQLNFQSHKENSGLDSNYLIETVSSSEADGSYLDYRPKTTKPEPHEVNTKIEWPQADEPDTSNQVKARQNGDSVVREYEMYEIGNADLWYTIQVQLFEKLTTPNGKTAWNDLTKGKPARVSSMSPEWTGQDMSILYKSSEWIPREGYTLPKTSLCLLAPVVPKSTATIKQEEPEGHYIVVPREDVVELPIASNNTKMEDDEDNDKLSQMEASTLEPGKPVRRVVIRSSRALLGDNGAKVNIVPRGEDQYLTMVHKLPYHAQIDLEARADANQLVHVGSLGRIMTVVADSSRRTRTVLTVKATNTGLAAARFKVIARECSPELPDTLHEKINEEEANFIVIPPKYTQNIIIDVPAEIPAEVAHCTVALVNGDHQSVAVRDVTIRKGDRCFCVWHCECVCLGEDPKLSCREMADARQVAAGLEVRERTRLVRAVCYHDVLSINFCFTAFGVIFTLLLFGFVKAFLGLGCRWIGMWGLARVLQMPRKLDHYYEPGLRERCVVYDEQGWPVHPDTKQRTVHLISLPMEFVLNIIFFVATPCVLVYEGIKQLCNRCKLLNTDESNWNLNKPKVHKKCYSSRENIIQSSGESCRQRRRSRLQRWMTPEAEELTSSVMQEGMPTRASMIKHYMRPLLCEGFSRGNGGGRSVGACDGGKVAAAAGTSAAPDSCGDSELDDTEYVLMQMQKSRDSLAKSQRKLGSTCTMANKQ